MAKHKFGKKGHKKSSKKRGGKAKIVPSHLMGKSLAKKHSKKARRKMGRKR